MKIQNYLFLSIFCLAGLMHCLCSFSIPDFASFDSTSPIEKEQSWHCLVAYSEDILGDSFIEQNKHYRYFNSDVAKVIDSYLPKKKLKALYLSVPYLSKFPNNPLSGIRTNMYSIIKNVLMLIKNPIYDVYVFEGATGLVRYGGWKKIASDMKDLNSKRKIVANALLFRKSFLNEVHSKSYFDEDKMGIIRLTSMICDIAKLDRGYLNLYDNEAYPRKEAYEKVLYPAYERVKKEQVVGSSLMLTTMGVLSRLKG